jgi:hypothetical protein
MTGNSSTHLRLGISKTASSPQLQANGAMQQIFSFLPVKIHSREFSTVTLNLSFAGTAISLNRCCQQALSSPNFKFGST